MWDWCGYFGEAGDMCLKVEKEKREYVVKTSDGEKYTLEEGKLRCISPYGVCVELKKKKGKFRAVLWFLPSQEKIKEVKLR